MPSEVRILPSPPGSGGTRRAGIAQLVEREPSKLGVAGSSPVSRSSKPRCANAIVPLPSREGVRVRLQAVGNYIVWNCSSATSAHVAQSVEHFLGKEEVTGSNPVVGFPNLAADSRARQEDTI